MCVWYIGTNQCKFLVPVDWPLQHSFSWPDNMITYCLASRRAQRDLFAWNLCINLHVYIDFYFILKNYWGLAYNLLFYVCGCPQTLMAMHKYGALSVYGVLKAMASLSIFYLIVPISAIYHANHPGRQGQLFNRRNTSRQATGQLFKSPQFLTRLLGPIIHLYVHNIYCECLKYLT